MNQFIDNAQNTIKYYEACSETGKYDLWSKREKHTVKRDPNIIQILEFADKDFKAAIRTMFEDEKEKWL